MGPALHARPDGCGESGDNVVLIHTTDSFEQAYQTIGELIVSNGFFIEHSDPVMGVATSGSKQVGFSTLLWSVKVSALVIGNENVTIMLTTMGQYDPGGPWWPADNSGAGRGLNMRAWGEICEIARQYPDGQISTRKR
jgi:hypothetical protein